VRTATRGRTIDIGGGATITLLTPPDQPITHSRSDVNANSVVVRLDYRQAGVLFAADAEPQTERWLLASNARLPAQVLKVAHHGGRYSSTPRFLRAVAPMAAVISVGEVNGYGHPTPETLGRLERLPTRVYRTDQDGTVTIDTDGARIAVTTANGKREILRPR
jgi:beta-lactamase superfamily II metal-dependent hydrolase